MLRPVFATSIAILLIALSSKGWCQERQRYENRNGGGSGGSGASGGGQYGGGGGFRGQQGGGGRSFDPKEFVPRMDRNNDGMISPDEINDNLKRFWSGPFEKAGLSMDKPIPVQKVIDAIAASQQDWQRGGGQQGRGSSSGEKEPEPRKSENKSSVPGFGADAKTAKVSGFDVASSSAIGDKKYSEEVVQRVDRALRENDRNGDGVLDDNELRQGDFKNYQENDTNHDGKLSRDELLERYSRRLSQSGGGGSGRSEAGQRPSGEDAGKFRQYAQSMIDQNDKDKSGNLEKKRGEWENLKRDHYAADTDHDDVITVDELSNHLASLTKPDSGRGGSGRKSNTTRSASSTADSKEERKSYRPMSPTERLPKGLPSWFTRNDEDGDGQIMMNEFAASWSNSKAEEFSTYDLDGDGIITAKECLKATEKADKKKE